MDWNKNILLIINNLSQKSPFFDQIQGFLVYSNIFKGGMFIAVFYGIWFSLKGEEITNYRRQVILATFTGMLLSLTLAKIVQHILPYQIKPILDQSLPFKVPLDFHIRNIHGSSFISDHATLFTSLTTGVFFISPIIGLSLFFYLLFLILFPRLYCGLHYPLDILIGSFFGFGFTFIACQSKRLNIYSARILGWSNNNKALFYFIYFIFTFQVAVLFEDIISILKLLKKL